MRVKTAESPAFSALRWLAGVCALLLVLVSAAGAAPANESVAVVTGPGAPELDRFAEGELCAYLEKLFGLHVRPATSIPAAARHVFLVGNPTTNPLVEKNSFPPVSDQGIVLKPKLGVAEQREWARQYERAWTALDAKHAISKVRSLDSVLAAAQKRKDYPGGSERAVSEVKADILALYFFDKVIADAQIQRLVQAAGKKFVVSVAEELYPVLGRIFPAGCETLNFVDYTPSRIVKRREVLKAVPAREVPRS